MSTKIVKTVLSLNLAHQVLSFKGYKAVDGTIPQHQIKDGIWLRLRSTTAHALFLFKFVLTTDLARIQIPAMPLGFI